MIYGKVRTEIGKILRELCLRKDVEILEAEACPDHIHMLVSIPPEDQRVELHGISEGEEQPDDIRQVCADEVRVREPAVLVSWVFCGLSRYR